MKKIGRYSLLITVKESYLFSRNLLGLFFHPFKTLRAIQREQDYSQAVLIAGLPFYILIAGLIFIISGRFLINAPAQWGRLAKGGLFFVCSFSLLVLIYLVYWLIEIRRIKKG